MIRASENLASVSIALGLACSPQQVNAKFITFQEPGATATVPVTITNDGEVLGFFDDQLGQHGFIRAADGTLTAIDVPGATATVAVAKNDDGTVAGSYFMPTDHVGYWRGFIRAPDGQVTELRAPHASRYTDLISINKAGWITGTGKRGRRGYFFGFVRSPSGGFTEFGEGLIVNCANSTLTTGGGLGSNGFVRTPDGIITQFAPDGATFTSVSDINDSGTAIGYSEITTPDIYEGFIRAADGTLSTFVANADAAATGPTGINKAGIIVGYYQNTDGSSHGFVRVPDGTITNIDLPGGSDTELSSINDRGRAAGEAKLNGVIEGFIWKP